jgi:hypothetical protein
MAVFSLSPGCGEYGIEKQTQANVANSVTNFPGFRVVVKP